LVEPVTSGEVALAVPEGARQFERHFRDSWAED
jgi:hypothetical protein